MKKFFVLLFLLLLFLFISADEIKNSNQPLKGQWDFGLKKIWETSTAGDQVLISVSTLRLDEQGNLFAFDTKHSRFFVYSPQGKFLYSFGKRGEGPGEYRMVFNFFLKGKKVIVPDMNKIHFFDISGKYLKSEIPGGAFIFPRIFIDEDRFVYVPSRMGQQKGSDRLELVDLKTKKKNLICEIPAEEVMEATANREGGQARLNIKDANTTPGVIVTYHRSHLYYGKNDRYTIQKADLTGKKMLSFSVMGRERKKITPDIKQKRLESFSLNGRKIPDDMIKQLMKTMPDQCTYFNRIWVDDTGLIYVFIPDMANDQVQEIDIFSSQGEYQYRAKLKLPDGYRFQRNTYVFKDQYLYVFTEDDDGEVKLIKYTIQLPKN
ncbi:MAG: 6-bladed beta-propeller [Candidatus Aminicenantes bacterium]|nr:6-bladed beta-propeller [Candidatus Aminicenantes bacterium]